MLSGTKHLRPASEILRFALVDNGMDGAQWMVSLGFVMLSATKHLGAQRGRCFAALSMTMRGMDDNARVGVVLFH